MSPDRERWDEKHRAAADAPPEESDPWVVSVLDARASAGRAVDLACGTGRHALELARRGYGVEGWDVSPVALEILRDRARSAGSVAQTRVVDLVADGLPADAPRFDLVVVVHFLDRPLYRELHRLVAPGGELVLTTFTVDWPGDRPSSRFRLARGELADGLPGLETLAYDEHGGCARLRSRARRVDSRGF